MSANDCDCSCDPHDGCPSDVYEAAIRTARKAYHCCECGAEIARGQRYERVDALCDGSWQHVTTCLTCRAIRRHYCPSNWVHGHLAEHISYCLGFDYRRVEEDGDA
jgi:hypothetical protein